MRRPLIALAATAALGATLFGCSSSDDSAGGSDGCTPTSTVAVGASDDLKFDSETYAAGTGCVEFVYTNNGSQAHTLLIKNVPDFKLSIGNEDKGAVELEPGAYVLYCDLPGHEAGGMVADLTIS